MNINRLRFPWKPVDVQLVTISENACIGMVTAINVPNFMLVSKSARFA